METIMNEDAQFPQVDRRFGLSVREFKREYQSAGKPVVITGAIEGWRARRSWTFEYFGSRYGETTIEVYHYEDGKYRGDNIEVVPLADFIDKILTNSWKTFPYYVRDDWKLFLKHTELLADYTVPQYFFDWFTFLPGFMRLIYPRIFIGPKGAITPLHHDIWETHAWLAQLVGRKRWILFSPNQRELLYNYQVRPEQPDLDRFPLFRGAKPLECTIGPGDIIFVPSGWAHQVTSLDPTISLTHNYMGRGCFWPCLANSAREGLHRRLKSVSLRRVAKLGSFLDRRLDPERNMSTGNSKQQEF